MTDLLRPHAEQLFADELAALERSRRPAAPAAVAALAVGGDDVHPRRRRRRSPRSTSAGAGSSSSPWRRSRPTARCCCSGVPGTAKTWLSEHLAAAISGDSTLIVQGTAGTPEEALRYGWNYARLLAEGPSRDALVAGPVFRAMQDGKIARVEELTRIPSDVQDALITILSEKTLPIPELDDEVQAVQGFNVIATANDRDRGVNELSSAMRRRFNTVVLPLPDTADEEVEIVRLRLDAIGGALELPPAVSALDEIRRVVTIFRELRSGVTEDGRTKIKSPSGTLSTAEAISVVTNGLALATHFGDGTLSAEDVAGGLTGAVVQDPVQDKIVWQEYLEAVVRERDGWSALYRACRDL